MNEYCEFESSFSLFIGPCRPIWKTWKATEVSLSDGWLFFWRNGLTIKFWTWKVIGHHSRSLSGLSGEPLHSLGTFIYSQNLFNEALKWLVVLATKECLRRFHLLTASILLFQSTVASTVSNNFQTASPMKRLLHFEMVLFSSMYLYDVFGFQNNFLWGSSYSFLSAQ